ncbi:MAG: DNA/RNA nuclease SfsA [Myxococcota bacterium]
MTQQQATESTLVPFGSTVVKGRFERRYKRFFVDVVLEATASAPARRITAHTPNTGSMKGLLEEGAPVLLTHDPSPQRKLEYTLQAIRVGTTWVGTNTMVPNRLAEITILGHHLDPLAGYASCRREVPYGAERSRIDLLLEGHVAGRPRCFVEVKNVTLREGAVALFPDAVSTRGTKHLHELARQVQLGDAAAMVYVVQRTDCTAMAPAGHIDPAYAAALREAASRGVMLTAVEASVDEEGVRFSRILPVHLE